MKKIFIILLILGIFFGVIYLVFKEGGLPVNSKDSTSKIFVVKRGDNVTDIANNLEQQNLIRNKLVFFIIVKQLGIEQKMQAGDFRLSSSMSAKEIAQSLTKGTLDTWVTIIEGLRKEEVAHIVATNIDVPETEIVARAREGYLFPDTYLIPKTATVDTVLSILSNNFEKKYSQALKERTADNGLTQNQIITLASLVEKEARSPKNKNIVASILYKRYKNNWPLQIDATVQYAIGYQTKEKSWWKKSLTKNDLAVDSPYNTYKNPGLPPGPIANPGIVSILAVMNATENTPYWYYISSRDGTTMHYAKTLDEHNDNIDKYLR